MKNRIVFFALTLIIASCSNSKLIKSIPMESSLEVEINKIAENNSAKIILTDERAIFANDLFVKADSVRFFNIEDSSYSVISLENVKKIRFVNHLEGAFFGTIAGGLLFRVLGYIIADTNPEGSNTCCVQIYMIGGAILGAVFGGVNGIHRNYEIVKNIEIVK